MKKLILSLMMALTLSNCTVMHGDASKGTYLLAAVGSDIKGYAQTATGATTEVIQNSPAFQELNKSVRFGLGAAALTNISSSGFGAWKSVNATKAKTSIANTAAKESTKQAQIGATAATKQAEIAAGTEQAAIAAGQ